MKRRIFAWILLAGFVLLLANLIFIRYQWGISILIYMVIMLAFVFSNKKGSSNNKDESSKNDENNDEDIKKEGE